MENKLLPGGIMNAKYLSLVTLLGGLLLTACSTTPVERKEDAAQGLTEMRDAVVQTRLQIDKTLSSLNTLISAPATELSKAYSQYAKDVEQLDKQVDKVQDQSKEMNAKGVNWLTEWHKSYSDIQDPELREVNEERRLEVTSQFDEIHQASRAARDALLPLLRDLQDVRTVVGNNLTTRSVRDVASTDVVRNAGLHAQTANRNLDIAISDFQELSNTLSGSN
jgi:hypothetical protein